MSFEERLKSLMKEKRITQNKLAEKISVSEASVHHYCRGENSPRMEILIELAKFFDVTTDYLLGLSDINKYQKDAQVRYEGFDESDYIYCPICGEIVGCNDESAEDRPNYCPECGTKLLY